MNKIFLVTIIAAVALPTIGHAQTHEIRKDEMKVQAQHEDLQDAVDNGDHKDIKKQAKDVRKAETELREDRQHHARTHYVAPYSNWSYAAVARGDKLRSRFYADRYAISDPGMYQLHPAARNQLWIRYGDDLVLVNRRNGRVIDVATARY